MNYCWTKLLIVLARLSQDSIIQGPTRKKNSILNIWSIVGFLIQQISMALILLMTVMSNIDVFNIDMQSTMITIPMITLMTQVFLQSA